MRRWLKKVRLFVGIVERPVTGDEGDTWFQAWRKYRLKPRHAWEVVRALYD